MEPKPVQEVLSKVIQKDLSLPELSLKEILESYNHIELTEDEVTAAMISAKRSKESMISKIRLKEREEQNRKMLIETKWGFSQTRDFMLWRAIGLFENNFNIDDINQSVFDSLCYYFSEDTTFESVASGVGVKDPSIKKGILLCGNFGVGKTWLMKLFAKNKRQVYFIRNAKNIASEYLLSKDKDIPEEYITPYKNATNDISLFFQSQSGLCIDDIGSEDVKNNYGNISNVIGDIIEHRYFKQFVGTLFHGTTNLTADELKSFYGERVTSRMREIFNFIELPGNDRRK